MRENTLLNYSILVALLLCICNITQGQTQLQQQVTVERKEVSILQVLTDLVEKEQINIAFSQDVIPQQSVFLTEQSITVGELLDDLFYKTALTYTAQTNQIVVHPIKIEEGQYFTLSGFLKDSKSGEPLIGATVYDFNSQQGTITNTYGFFSLTIPAGELQLQYSFVGYTPLYDSFFLGQDIRENEQLTSVITLGEVIVESDTKSFDITDGLSTTDLSPSVVFALPALGGEKDVLRTAHFLPGVTTGADGLDGIFVRGGSASQNLVLIDGVPIYYMSHVGGLFSIFNTYAIRSTKLIKGAFPARYGGRLSSILDVRTKEGNNKELKGNLDIGALAFTSTLEGPIIKDKSSFFFAVRKSFLNFYLNPLSKEHKKERGEDGESEYKFYDVNGKVNFYFSDEDKLFFSFYSGSDELSDDASRLSQFTLDLGGERDFEYSQYISRVFAWENNVGSLRWNHLFTDKLFSNTALTYSQLSATSDYYQIDSLVDKTVDNTLERSEVLESYKTFINDMGLKIDFDYIPNSSHYIKFGLQSNFRRFAPRAISIKDFGDSNSGGEDPVENLYSQSISLWGEETFTTKKWIVDAGLRSTLHSVDNAYYQTFEPRLAVSFLAKDHLTLSASYSKMTQFLHLLSNTEIGLPTDLWVPSTAAIKPEKSHQYVVGAGYEFDSKNQITIEAFYKQMTDLVDFSEGALLINNWQKNVTQGDGISQGIELAYAKKIGKTKGWIAYTLAHTDRTFEHINLSRTYPFKYDRRHSVQVVLNHVFNDNFSLSASWLFNTGSAFSAPVSKYRLQFPDAIDVISIPAFEYGTKNQFRMPDYHRLDVSLNIHIPTEIGDHNFQLGVNNVYNRTNPLYYQFRSNFISVNGNLVEENDFTQLTLVRLLPNFSYNFSF